MQKTQRTELLCGILFYILLQTAVMRHKMGWSCLFICYTLLQAWNKDKKKRHPTRNRTYDLPFSSCTEHSKHHAKATLCKQTYFHLALTNINGIKANSFVCLFHTFVWLVIRLSPLIQRRQCKGRVLSCNWVVGRICCWIPASSMRHICCRAWALWHLKD